MKWQKLGLIFDPTKHNLPHNCFAFAKSPQVIVFDNFIRIYYSAAEKDTTGKILCRVLYVDFDKNFKKIVRHSDKEVIPLGNLGEFDEHGIFPFHVYKDFKNIKAYTTGWSRRKSVSVETAIGYAESHDGGESFIKLGNGPIMTANVNEPFLVCDGFIFKEEDLYYMYYIYGIKWSKPSENEEAERVYKIAMATSNDGLNWVRDSKCIISDVIDENECQALPTVLKFGNKYHMYFCFRDMIGFRTDETKGYRIGYAYSEDLKKWIRDDENSGIGLSEFGWDSKMMCYPHIFKLEDHIYMLYNGNEFGKYGFGLAKLINY
ncbi:MAG: hypothetical protein M0P66_16200 [Salinivirgaceae bacterium]|nr:hypothetical protein [Salinivirgaceae bacterium]